MSRQRIYFKTSALKRIPRFKFVPVNTMILLYKTFLVPHLEYCNTVFVGLVKVRSGRLEDANYYILRTLFMTKNESYESLLNLVGWRILWNTVVITRGGGTPGNSCWGCAARCSKCYIMLYIFQTKKCNFPYPFSDQASRIHTRFQTWPVDRNYIIITLTRAQKKNSSPFRIRMFLFLSYSFGIERINTFINCRSSLENHTRSQTKMGEVHTRFLTKTAQKP